MRRAERFRPDVVLIVKGAYVSPETLRSLKRERRIILANYATDDPLNPRVNTPDLVKGIGCYDLYASPRQSVMDDLRRRGAGSVLYLPFAYKPSVHFREPAATEQEQEEFSSDVLFAGGCDGDRIPYFETLVSALPDLNLHLYGGYWDRHPRLRKFHRGFATGRAFRLALSGTKIAVNLVRRANRDGHVMRTFEVPACGAFMLAERTAEHEALFEERREAAYFGTADELVDRVRHYLVHEAERRAIAAKAHATVTQGGHTYKDRLIRLLGAVSP